MVGPDPEPPLGAWSSKAASPGAARPLVQSADDGVTHPLQLLPLVLKLVLLRQGVSVQPGNHPPGTCPAPSLVRLADLALQPSSSTAPSLC